jgi:hypothetical protein
LRSSGNFGTSETHFVIGGSATFFKIVIEGANARTAQGRRRTHATARTARDFESAHARYRHLEHTAIVFDIVNICREPGESVMCKLGATLLPFIICAVTIKSRYDELTDEPTDTCRTGIPTISFTGTTLSGLCGCAINGSNFERSISISSS